MGSSFGVISQTGNNIQTEGLVFYVDPAYKISYPGTGTSITDIESDFSGLVTNSPTFDPDQGGGVFNYDGSHMYLNFASADIGNILDNQKFTLCAWCKLDGSNSTGREIFGYRASSWVGIGFYNIGTNTLVFQLGDKTTTAVNSQSGNWSFYNSRVSSWSDGNWKCIIGTWDGTDSKIYINGNLEATATPPATLTIDYATCPDNARIGQRNDGSNMPWEGQIGPVQVYNRTLSAGDVLQNYNAQKGRFGL